MNKIFKSLLNLISTILYFAIFFVIMFVATQCNSILDVFKLNNILLLAISLIVYCSSNYFLEKLSYFVRSTENSEKQGSKKEELLSKFMDGVMEYCVSLGLNPTVTMGENNEAILVDVNESTHEFTKIVELTLPNNEELTEKNFNLHLEHFKDVININIEKQKRG